MGPIKLKKDNLEGTGNMNRTTIVEGNVREMVDMEDDRDFE